MINRLYTDNDVEVATDYLAEYIERNNKPEQKAIYGKYMHNLNINHNHAIQLVRNAYGVNIATMANFLQAQDQFFSTFMPHWLSYLPNVGLETHCTYFKSSDVCTPYFVIKQLQDSKYITRFKPYLPHEKWTDFSDISGNLMNPLSIFYTAYLNIYDVENTELIEAINRFYNMKNPVNPDNVQNMALKVLPSFGPNQLEKLTRILHRYT